MPVPTLACQIIFGPTRGRQIEELVERATDAPCPCKAGRQCMLTDKDGRSPLLPDAAEVCAASSH